MLDLMLSGGTLVVAHDGARGSPPGDCGIAGLSLSGDLRLIARFRDGSVSVMPRRVALDLARRLPKMPFRAIVARLDGNVIAGVETVMVTAAMAASHGA